MSFHQICRRPICALVFLLFGALSHTPAYATPYADSEPRQIQTQTMHRVQFTFHSAFLMNLHHFLYDMAVHKDKLAGTAWSVEPTKDEMQALDKAVEFYRSNYAKLGLREDPLMISIKQALSVEDGKRDATGLALPPALVATLNEVAPIYARTLWPMHDGSNRSWIAKAIALDQTYGAEVQAGIEHFLGAPFPMRPIRSDIVFDTGSRQGAYTDEQIVIPSARVDYQGLASLEMLYHEASHTTVTDKLEEAVSARLKATGRGESDVWHVAQFYTVGTVTHDVLAKHGIADYQTYADKRGLYKGYWAPLMPAIEAAWIPHMQDKMDLQEAAKQMVDRLPVQ